MNSERPELAQFHALSNDELIKRYLIGLNKINPQVLNLNDIELKMQFHSNPTLGEWSCLELLGHLTDAELVFTHRLRRVVAEDRPTFAVWDENAFIKNGLYWSNSASDFFNLIQSLRNLTGKWLSELTELQFNRIGTHPQKGKQSMRTIIIYATWHLEHHAWYLDDKIEKLTVK